ncbi:helix-turn-helix domain-containing protein [Methyloglobulus sp.]|uniref:helix-turn-helix domain-containing protein n=1 Tax=Methyloglobulus sp. TaxID=2518622 RepID=UPI0039895E88
MDNKTTAQQRGIIHAYLRACGNITTIEARTMLGVMHPAWRIMELRRGGANIVTHWATVLTPKGKHRVARYVLLSGGGNG